MALPPCLFSSKWNAFYLYRIILKAQLDTVVTTIFWKKLDTIYSVICSHTWFWPRNIWLVALVLSNTRLCNSSDFTLSRIFFDCIDILCRCLFSRLKSYRCCLSTTMCNTSTGSNHLIESFVLYLFRGLRLQNLRSNKSRVAYRTPSTLMKPAWKFTNSPNPWFPGFFSLIFASCMFLLYDNVIWNFRKQNTQYETNFTTSSASFNPVALIPYNPRVWLANLDLPFRAPRISYDLIEFTCTLESPPVKLIALVENSCQILLRDNCRIGSNGLCCNITSQLEWKTWDNFVRRPTKDTEKGRYLARPLSFVSREHRGRTLFVNRLTLILPKEFFVELNRTRGW